MMPSLISDEKFQHLDAEVQVHPNVKYVGDGGENREALPSLSHIPTANLGEIHCRVEILTGSQQ
jgi:hypothetical protein